MMFRHLFPFRRLLATSFLLVFVNVFAGQCYCASLRQYLAVAPETGKATKPAQMAPGHACCRAKAAGNVPKSATKQAHALQQKKHSDTDGCCRKKAATLFAGPDNPAAKQLLSPAPALLPEANHLSFRSPSAGQWDRTAAVRLVPPQHLPPKIPDIRIFIRSLTV